MQGVDITMTSRQAITDALALIFQGIDQVNAAFPDVRPVSARFSSLACHECPINGVIRHGRPAVTSNRAFRIQGLPLVPYGSRLYGRLLLITHQIDVFHSKLKPPAPMISKL